MRKLIFGLIAGFLALATPAFANHEEGGQRWTVMLRNGLADEEGEGFWWNADYDRLLPSGAGWVDGDRAGYRCLYGFLEYRDRIVGRVTFIRVETGLREAPTYAFITDKFMHEGVRFYDGTLAPEGSSRELGDCPTSDFAYEPYFGPDERPTVTFERTRGGTLETRDYKATVTGNGIKFRQVESSPQRVGVVAYFENNPAIVVYYDSLSPRVSILSDLG